MANTQTEQKIIEALTSGGVLSSGQISKVTSLHTGKLFTALADLEKAGKITSEWETPNPKPDETPRRRIYRKA